MGCKKREREPGRPHTKTPPLTRHGKTDRGNPPDTWTRAGRTAPRPPKEQGGLMIGCKWKEGRWGRLTPIGEEANQPSLNLNIW